MVLAAAARALKKAQVMKEKVLSAKDLLADNESWIAQQQLQCTYRRVLILDLEYALDKKVEQDLWTHAFKNCIARLQAIAKDKKHPRRPQGQAMLHWCLEAAAGFYLCLLQEVCSAFDLDLPFRRHNALFGLKSTSSQAFSKDSVPSKSSCYYICQHCLVHLGDIARYRNQNRQAENFYRYAVMLSPTSGQPYNQLAILEASRGDKVSAVFHYVRAVALSHPFPAAATNLSRAFEKHSEDLVKTEGHSKLSSHEYLSAFLKLHGLLHSHAELDTAEKLVQILTTSLTAHIATESLSGWKLVQIVAINIFALQRVRGGGEGPQLTEEELTGTELKVKSLISHFLAGCLNAFLLPVYTIKNEEPLLEYFAMPAIKLTVEWIRIQPDILQSPAFSTRRQIWPSLCRLLNQLQSVVKDFSASHHEHVPLPEDRDLQGFLPFEKTFQDLNFNTEDLKTDLPMLNKLRAARLVSFGAWLTEQAPALITGSSLGSTDGKIVFEPVGRPEPPADLLKEFEELSLGKVQSLGSSSEGSGSLDSPGSSTPDSNGHSSNQELLPEKRGILKSETPVDKVEAKTSNPRGVRNVALATIMNQKITEDTKQVTFRTPSPAKGKTPKSSPAQKKSTGQNKEAMAPKAEKPKEKETIKSEQVKPENKTLLQQQKLMDVLTPKEKTVDPKKKSAAVTGEASMDNSPKSKDQDNSKTEQTQQKQQLLSALFDASTMNQQPQNMSGLLNLSKQQQEMLSSSKQQPRPQPTTRPPPGPPRLQQANARPAAQPGQQSVVEKMEAARKEYEDAMFVLKQKKQEQLEHLRYQGEGDGFRYDRMFPMANVPPPGPPSHVFVALNQPVMGMSPMSPMQQMSPLQPMAQMSPMQPMAQMSPLQSMAQMSPMQPMAQMSPMQQFAFKLQPGMVMPWQEPEQPPMPPASWWADRFQQPPPPHLVQGREPPGYRQPQQLSTYSLFSSSPMAGDADPNIHVSGRLLNQQSLWSGPGPSPLERLLEQQRQRKQNEPNT